MPPVPAAVPPSRPAAAAPAAVSGPSAARRADRGRAALLGLALGDACGRRLEFVSGPAVRTRPVGPGAPDFRWTDDTHMALYLVEALAALGRPGLADLDEDALGQAVGAAFLRWSEDPLTPSTAPGQTCLRGAAAFARTGDWRRSGVRESDGCGAVMRIAPLPVVLAGPDLVRAARVQSAVTHAHPSALAAAVAGCLLTGALLDGAPLAPATVRDCIRRLEALGEVGEDGVVVAALRAALDQAARPGLRWLDEAAVPAGDGGWRSPSALGLAVVAALRWGEDFAHCVEQAARIDGDSDSVACLAGMLVGAARGTAALPADWLAALPERARVEAAAATLAALGPPGSAGGRPAVRTSESDPLAVDSLVASL